ncbi:hypothetical protein [Kangiella aquimarina]|uniref:Uncharacterized protein n=1 Tax=Kangiella aquimarina TaxID=261965 RepID=A0ABZ0X4G0_9GAMM|nr:hypothetical protein [Kangiella aquimarina]WQG85487.1 hypothetical protein SR900_01075 [Kangiella aquimarina]
MSNNERKYKEVYESESYAELIEKVKLSDIQAREILMILEGRSSGEQSNKILEIMERGLLEKSLVKIGPKKNSKLELTQPLGQLESCLEKAIEAIDSLPGFERKMLEQEFLIINGEMLNGGRNGEFYDDSDDLERVVFRNADNWSKIIIKMYNTAKIRRKEINEGWTKEDHTYTNICREFTRSFDVIFPNEKVRVPFSNDKSNLYGDLMEYFIRNILDIPFSPQKYIKKALKYL